MSKNFPHATLNKSTREGRSFFQLVCRDDYLCRFFDSWSYSLAKKRQYRTVKAYAYAVKRFLNYFLEAENQLGEVRDFDLFQLLQNYESYLAFGVDSDITLVQKIATVFPPGELSGATIEQAMAGLNHFLAESESFRVQCLQLLEAGYIDSSTTAAGSGILNHFGSEAPSEYVKRAVRQSSWLSGCINGGMKRVKVANLKVKNKASTIIFTDEFGGDDKTFPLDLAVTLIKSAPNLRDQLLWSLLAASGIRISEAQTMFEEDVVIETASKNGKKQKNKRIIAKKVLVIDPDTRRSELIKHLSETEINALPHKGRAQPTTFLIEPFASLFWGYLAKYKADENKKQKGRPLGAQPPFLFKKIKTGEPLINSYNSLYQSFSAVAKKVTGETYGFHSLRHMYAYYVKNFAPTGDGRFGLSLKQVQMLLGHKNIKSTERYAREDFAKLEAALSAINMARSNDQFFNVNEAKIRFLEDQIARLQASVQSQKEIGNA